MDRGYVCLYRKMLESDLWQHKNAHRIFEFLLLSATRIPRKHVLGSRVLELQPGDFVCSQRQLAKKCGLTVKEVRGALAFLYQADRVSRRAHETAQDEGEEQQRAQERAQKRAQECSVFSIVNWHTYQPGVSPEGTGKGTEKGATRAQERAQERAQQRAQEPGVFPFADSHTYQSEAAPEGTAMGTEKGTTKGAITRSKDLKNESSSVKPLLDLYVQLFEEKFGNKPVLNFARDSAILKGLLKVLGEDAARDVLCRFFADSDPFIVKSGYSIGVLSSQANRFLVEASKESSGASAYEGTGGRRLETLT